jgi:hypothetical protein
VLPVLSSCSISLADLFGNNNALVIVKEIAGTQMYWPEMEIFTLTDIEPGKAYLVYVQSSFELSFPGCDE